MWSHAFQCRSTDTWFFHFQLDFKCFLGACFFISDCENGEMSVVPRQISGRILKVIVQICPRCTCQSVPYSAASGGALFLPNQDSR